MPTLIFDFFILVINQKYPIKLINLEIFKRMFEKCGSRIKMLPNFGGKRQESPHCLPVFAPLSLGSRGAGGEVEMPLGRGVEM